MKKTQFAQSHKRLNTTTALTASLLLTLGMFSPTAATAQGRAQPQASANNGADAAPDAAAQADAAASPLPPAPPAANAQPARAEQDLVVTGTRIPRNGYSAPTPVTVVGADRIQNLGLTSTIDLVNSLPAARPSTTTTSPRPSGGSIPGVSNVDLRGIGAVRTLVLVNGRRFVPNGTNGTVDLSFIPTSLISRVEVVTGGASAAYGADAVAGVVNFILDTRLQGVRAEASLGVTQRGDDFRRQASIAAGTSFASGAGHIVLGVDYSNDDGQGDCYSQSFCNNFANSPNPGYGTNGLPGVIRGPGFTNARASVGGLIVASPAGTTGGTLNALRGIAWAPDGSTFQYNFGQLVNLPNGQPGSGIFGIGGTDERALFFLRSYPTAAPLEHYNAFVHASYDIGGPQVFAEFGYGHLRSTDVLKRADQGNLTIRADNAFLPASIRTAMAAGGIPSFTFGRLNDDLVGSFVNDSNTYRGVVGLEGDIWHGWNLSLYYQYGRNEQNLIQHGNRLVTEFANALDAVLSPTTGQIVCRSSIANPTNGCVPINLFGVNQFSPAALHYITADGFQRNVFQQHVLSGTISGSPFHTWAGQVSIAAGGEYRHNSTNITVDPLSAANRFVQLNPQPSSGTINVAEGFAETVVPLARNMTLMHDVELNGAIRYTRTTARSGLGQTGEFNATTWKVGLVWEPIEQLRLRVTRSRDIRAPNAVELFTAPLQTSATIRDLTSGVQVTNLPVISSGNINARPEVADTFTAGAVLRLGRFGLSVDYYNIDIKDALGTLGTQVIADRCFAGDQSLCALIDRNAAGVPIRINTRFINIQSIQVRGIDLDLSYRLPLPTLGLSATDSVAFRVFATHIMDILISDGAGVTNFAGVNGQTTGLLASASWIVDGTATFTSGPVSVTAQGHYISRGIETPTLVTEGEPGYALTGNPQTTNSNDIAPRFYANLIGEVHIGPRERGVTFFAGVYNLFDKTPPNVSSSRNVTNPVYYDILLRRFTMGVRARF